MASQRVWQISSSKECGSKTSKCWNFSWPLTVTGFFDSSQSDMGIVLTIPFASQINPMRSTTGKNIELLYPPSKYCAQDETAPNWTTYPGMTVQPVLQFHPVDNFLAPLWRVLFCNMCRHLNIWIRKEGIWMNYASDTLIRMKQISHHNCQKPLAIINLSWCK